MLLHIDDKVQFATNPAYGDAVAGALRPIKERELSRTLLEVLAIIAYKQPTTRGEIEEVRGGQIDSSCVKAFRVPAGVPVLVYETTLHYAPCGRNFRVIVGLPAGTNTEKPEIDPVTPEDKYLWARNKWLLAHKDTAEAKQGACIGISGENIDICDSL